MAQPKRKSPDRSRSTRKPQPSRLRLIGGATLTALGRHPRILAGIGTFAVVFSFVAANALWYQPRHHPSPLLATRMFEDAAPAADEAPESVEQAIAEDPGVTTFRIERQPEEESQVAAPAPVRKQASPLIRDIQQALGRRGLYDGPADGLSGPKTTSAILFFEETEGLAPTGLASTELLARLTAGQPGSQVAADKPSPDTTASTRKTDDVAALIETSSKTLAVVPEPKPVSPALVMKIQQALADMAYKGVKVDGIAGEATRSAIRAFEKSYRMKITGEPSEQLLKKLKSIGAV